MSISYFTKSRCTTASLQSQATKAVLVSLITLAFVLAAVQTALPDPPDSYANLEQLGSFSDKDNAQALVGRLDKDGKVAFIVEKVVGGKTFYSVVLDHSPPAIVKDAMRARIAVDEEKALEEAVPASETVVPTQNGEPGPSISLMTDATVYNSPSPEADPIGTYSSLGGGQYVRQYKEFHSLWLPALKRYGFVMAEGTRMADYTPQRDEIANEDPGTEVVLPTRNGLSGKSIAILTNTMMYNAPSADAARLGEYSSLGNGSYESFLSGFHGVWFPDIQGYGYVGPDEVRDVEYSPDEPVAEDQEEAPDEQ